MIEFTYYNKKYTISRDRYCIHLNIYTKTRDNNYIHTKTLYYTELKDLFKKLITLHMLDDRSSKDVATMVKNTCTKLEKAVGNLIIYTPIPRGMKNE